MMMMKRPTPTWGRNEVPRKISNRHIVQRGLQQHDLAFGKVRHRRYFRQTASFQELGSFHGGMDSPAIGRLVRMKWL